MPTDDQTTMSTREVLRFGPVRALMIANFVLYTGASLQAAALMLQAYEITGREADLGWIGLCEFLPAALLVLVTGSVADRMDRKKIALVGITGEVVCSIALLAYALSDPTEVWPLFVIAFCYGVARAFLAPATRPMPAMVAPEGGLPRVIALYSATWSGATMLGPGASCLLSAWQPSVAQRVAATITRVAGVSSAARPFPGAWMSRDDFMRLPEPVGPPASRPRRSVRGRLGSAGRGCERRIGG